MYCTGREKKKETNLFGYYYTYFDPSSKPPHRDSSDEGSYVLNVDLPKISVSLNVLLKVCIFCIFSDSEAFYEIVRLRKQMALARLCYV